ncbi:glycoside hydrolase family 99-like domain-containing protein [Bifidobacterium longum]
MFMYAWNEWAEGGYLEPDERFGYGNLEAIRKALIENDEFPTYPENIAE